MEGKDWFTLILGLILLVLGVIPFLNKFGIVSFGLNFLPIMQFVSYIISIAALWLIIEGFMEDEGVKIITIIVGLIILAIGVIPLLNSFGVISFAIPFLSVTLYNIIFILEGILLVIAAFKAQ
ncbi:hypothetical protein D6745_00180 [Candidatus Woesearchaeota archaeon]|nr:MAG: hypothetical protein D6745_00180 [Candidatus Woesearchaeota archaeon]